MGAAEPTTRPEVTAVKVTDSLRVSSSGGTVHLGQSVIMPGGEYLTWAVIMTPEVARSVAASLVELAHLGEPFEPVGSDGLPLYRCLGVCGHITTSEAEMAAHDSERHEGDR